MQMEVFKVFGKTATTGGNLMAVVSEPVNAADSGIPVTVMVEQSRVADVRFRFFYPGSIEAPICGHALLGAAQTVDSLNFSIETGAGICEVTKADGVSMVNFGRQRRVSTDFDDIPSPDWFGLTGADMTIKGVYSAGKAKLCIEVTSLAKLNAVKFDLTSLAEWNRGKKFSGYILYSIEQGQVYARASNPLFNIPEDSACGVCCAALPVSEEGALTVQMGSPEYPNELNIEFLDSGVWVGGKVFVVSD